jgi:hypothetical protein
VLFVATVHYRSPRWVEIQTRHLREHLSDPYQIWTSLEHIDATYGRHFDRVLTQRGTHAGKLNHLALEISQVAADEDLLMFLDGDAFPIADPMPLIECALAKTPLVAVRRAENMDEPQPHPSFCVTTVLAWRTLAGDWTAGSTWRGTDGKPTSDVGGNLLRRLELTKTPWTQVLRSNRKDVDPLYFGIYGGVIYHHGAGFRTGELNPVDRSRAPRPLLPDAPRALRPLGRALNGPRWRLWHHSRLRRHLRESNRIYERIRSGDADWLAEFM